LAELFTTAAATMITLTIVFMPYPHLRLEVRYQFFPVCVKRLAAAVGTKRTYRAYWRCEFIDVNRTSRLGAQVVRIAADLLHFQPAPSASESSIGGVDLIGAKVAAQASVRDAIMSKDRFIAILLFPVC
jgi:hypothetical protein